MIRYLLQYGPASSFMPISGRFVQDSSLIRGPREKKKISIAAIIVDLETIAARDSSVRGTSTTLKTTTLYKSGTVSYLLRALRASDRL